MRHGSVNTVLAAALPLAALPIAGCYEHVVSEKGYLGQPTSPRIYERAEDDLIIQQDIEDLLREERGPTTPRR